METQIKIKSLFTTLFALLLLCNFTLAGCSSSGAPSPTISTNPAASVQPSNEQTDASANDAAGDVSYISMDINPSISLTVQYGVVFSATACNDDASEILLSVDVTGMTPEEAVTALITAFASDGYISTDSQNAAIVITVHGPNEQELVANLESVASASLANLGISCDVVASAVEYKIAQEAEAMGMTPGKYLIVKYLAEQDGISFEEARALYGDSSMKDLLRMISDVNGVFGEGAYVFLAGAVAGLTSDQLALLDAALAEYKDAMNAAVQAYLQAKELAREYFRTARDEAHAAFKSTGDHEAWQSARTTAKNEMERQYSAAKQTFKDAKRQAADEFLIAIAGLGLTEDQTAVLLEWNFELNWDFDMEWGEAEAAEVSEDPEDQQSAGAADEEGIEGDHSDGGNNHGNGHGGGHS